MMDLSRKIGPFPLPVWVFIGAGGVVAFRYLMVNKPNRDSATTDYSVLPEHSPWSWMPSHAVYGPPHVVPLSFQSPSPTPGCQGGMMRPGIGPSTLPPAFGSTNMYDPTTGNPISTGPNGEGGWSWDPETKIPYGRATFQMSDGRWASYIPGRNVQNGNRVALGLSPIDTDSSAPGSNPVAVASLRGDGYAG